MRFPPPPRMPVSVNLNLAAARCLGVVLSVLPPHTLENLAEGAAEVGLEAVRTDGAACSASVESNPKTGAACVFRPSAEYAWVGIESCSHGDGSRRCTKPAGVSDRTRIREVARETGKNRIAGLVSCCIYADTGV